MRDGPCAAAGGNINKLRQAACPVASPARRSCCSLANGGSASVRHAASCAPGRPAVGRPRRPRRRRAHIYSAARRRPAVLDAETLARCDAAGICAAYDRWPEDAAAEYGPGGPEPVDLRTCGRTRHFVFAGMGGSGTVGDAMSSILSKAGVHVDVVKGYVLPRVASRDTVVVATSVSGNTEETVAVLDEACERGCLAVGFSSGGALERLCADRGVPHRRIGARHSPRGSFAAFVYGMLRALGPVLPGGAAAYAPDSISHMSSLRDRVRSSNLDPSSNPALALAEWLSGVPVIYYPAGLRTAAVRFKNSLQENAKMHATAEDVIEACHNGIVPWALGAAAGRPVLVRGRDDHAKTRQRWSILESMFRDRGIPHYAVDSVGGDILSKIVNLVYLLDYATIYRAALSGTDPTPIEAIDYVKGRLGGPGGAAPPAA